MVKRKVCLVGEQGVGKTSLIRRFTLGTFSGEYLRTLGAAVSKKPVVVPGEPEATRVDLVILDIMGARTFMQLFRDAYFSGAAGVLAVFDLTRKASLEELPAWIRGVRQTVGTIPVVAIGNKTDLPDRVTVGDADVEAVLAPFGVQAVRTSARTGENVEQAFLSLARAVLTPSYGQRVRQSEHVDGDPVDAPPFQVRDHPPPER